MRIAGLRRFRNPHRGDSSIWRDFMRACLRAKCSPEFAAKTADESLALYRERFPTPAPEPDDDELAELDSMFSDSDDTSESQ